MENNTVDGSELRLHNQLKLVVLPHYSPTRTVDFMVNVGK